MLSNLLWWPWHGLGSGVVPPIVGQYNPVGDSEPSLLDRGPVRRGRRRRRESIYDEEEVVISVITDNV